MYVVQSSISRNFVLLSKFFIRDFINLLVKVKKGVNLIHRGLALSLTLTILLSTLLSVGI